MGLFDKLFKKRSEQPTTSNDAETLLGFCVVFDGANPYTADALKRTLATMDTSLRAVDVQAMEGTYEQDTPLTRVSFGQHVIDMVGMPAPMPKEPLENCVQPAHYGQDIKAKIRAHKTHTLLYYSGTADDVVERYVAIAVVAGALSKHHGIAILHEAAMTSLPASVLYDMAKAKPNFNVLRHLPQLYLYCGFVKYFLKDRQSAWMRTYNCPRFKLPDLAMKRPNDQAQATFDMFTDMLGYLQNSGRHFKPGETADFGASRLRFRAPRDNEIFPTHTDGQLLIVEEVPR